MATPHVTGVAALLKSQYPNIGDGQMKSIILDSVDKKSTLSGKVLSGGRLNVVKAIRQCATMIRAAQGSLRLVSG